MTRALLQSSLLLAGAVVVLGQNPTPPAFEVASIRPCTADQQGQLPIGLFTFAGGRIKATNYTLKLLIHDAYDIEMYRIVGGPSWLDSDRYNLEAKPPDSSPSAKWTPANFKTPPNPEMRQMLQALLAERFQLKVRRESRSESVYALVVAKGGPKLQEPKDASKQPFVSFGRTGPVTATALSSTMTGRNATMDLLVDRLAQTLRRPVLNRSGLRGNFDFFLEYSADDSQSAAAPSLSRAIQDQLGLKLETQPGSVDVLVVDHAEKSAAN
jgi:uncharacterized protein (TIGR03435 family)